MNERWRVALAGLVAALAIPFLIIDSPVPAEGVETTGAAQPDASAVETVTSSTTTEPVAAASENVAEVTVVRTAVSPDVTRLADQAGTWAAARSQAIAAGLVEASPLLPAPRTDLSLLPQLDTTPSTTTSTTTTAAPEPAETPDPDPVVESGEGETVDPDAEGTDGETTDPDAETPAEEITDPDGDTGEEEVTEPVEEEPDAEPADPEGGEEEGALTPTTPAQINGRVPPPAGGPTGAQWDALRNCESTHNYRAVSPTGKFRGAYQFSVQTWDWVAGLHQPHLVGIDPIDADPAWQDVMAYTLFAMSGWGQWPECGVHLL